MKGASLLLSICGAGATFSSSPVQAASKNPLSSLGMEHFRDTATVLNAPQDPTAIISTENGFSEKHGPMRTVWDDEYLIATIDKKSAHKSYQLMVWVTYAGSEREYQDASLDAPQGRKILAGTRIASRKEYCSIGECTFTERVAFPVEEDLLRQMAGQGGSGTIWSFRMTGKSGPTYSGVLSGAEAAGLLAKVDGFHSALPVVAASATQAALKAGLGVEGIAVEADAEHPNRGGVLITGVAHESVAHQASLIVGDIIYELNGHPLKTLADLQKAAADCAPNSTVPIKLYRGLLDTQLSARF